MLSALLSAVVLSQLSPAMKESFDAVTTMTPWLSSPDAFRDPQHHEDIARALATLSKLKHPFLRGSGTSSTSVAKLFGNQAKWAKDDFLARNTESARYRTRGLTQLCLACHLREPTRDFVDVQRKVERMVLPPLQQAELFALTRQTDRALEVWGQELGRTVRLDSELYEQLDGLRLAVGVAVRLRDDPKLVQQLLAPQLFRFELPGFALREVEAWNKDAVAWEKDRFALADQTPTTLMTRARSLIESAGAEDTEAAVSERYVALLRAASYLDEALRQAPDGPYRAEALYLLGVVHPTVADSPLWQLEWMYFEACIRENAGTPIAQTCAQRLKDRTWYIGVEGSELITDGGSGPRSQTVTCTAEQLVLGGIALKLRLGDAEAAALRGLMLDGGTWASLPRP